MKLFGTFLFLTTMITFSFAQNLLSSPQKILYDAARDQCLVSNYGGDGDLVKISRRGTQSYIVEGAEMIDGMEIIGDVVYGSSTLGSVKGYNIITGELVMSLGMSGSGVEHLSSFAVDSAGILYTSERFGDRIFKINPITEEYWVFAQGAGLDEPNGILYERDNNRLVVCLDQNNPSILGISLEDSSVTVLATTTLSGSDGITRDQFGFYYITGYYLPGIYRFNPDFSGEPELFFSGSSIVYPDYKESTHSLLITYYDFNDWGEVFLETSATEGIETPVRSKLLGSFPNPFNPSTTILYSLTEFAQASLVIYDLKGRVIRSLVSEFQYPGNYGQSWDGTDSDGESVPSGVYFASLHTRNQTHTTKLVFLP